MSDFKTLARRLAAAEEGGERIWTTSFLQKAKKNDIIQILAKQPNIFFQHVFYS